MTVFPNTTGDGARLRLIGVTPQLLLSLRPGRFEVVRDPLPEDSRVVRSAYDPVRDLFVSVVESASFEPVAEGAAIPWHEPPHVRRIEAETEA